jgi:Glu-tRNA(Gln) amidotransferase subunit E-like FAD-binding protein
MDYKKLGFKCGIEIHQQLETHKLFCSCPSLVNDEHPNDIKIIRKLRPSAGETGEIDKAALHEMKKGKYFVYEAASTSACLVEFDEEPPHKVNEDALDTALIVAKLINADIVDEIQFMRKTVIDGSNTSGFQRTALVATNGYIETSLGKVGIPVLCLEEEAAKKIKKDEKSVTYRLDRLGVALLEIATDPDIQNPEHAKEVAGKIGMILRSTERVKRGLGTIRQDVNISIKSGARVEIKGFQDLKSIPKIIENEIVRQKEIIKKGKKIVSEVRKAESDFSTSFLRPMPGAARMYPETDVPIIPITAEMLTRIEIPELITEKAVALEKKYGISDVLASEIIKLGIDFGHYVGVFKKVKPNQIAEILVNIPKDIKSRLKHDSDKLKQEDFEEVLGYLNDGKIGKAAVIEVLVEKIKGNKVNLAKYEGVDDKKLEIEIKKIIVSKKGLSVGAYMGMIMGKFRGKVDGKKVMEILKKEVK